MREIFKYFFPPFGVNLVLLLIGFSLFKSNYFIPDQYISDTFNYSLIIGGVYLILSIILAINSYLLFSGSSKGITFEKRKENYFLYVVRSSIFTLIFNFLIIVREVIGSPLIYKFPEHSFVKSFFDFFILNFSPIYFTVLILFTSFILLMRIYQRFNELLKSKLLLLTVPSSLIILFPLFNYGFLNGNSQAPKVIILDIEDFNPGYMDKRYSETFKNLRRIYESSIRFSNFFTSTTDRDIERRSFYSMRSPNRELIFRDIPFQFEESLKRDEIVVDGLDRVGVDSRFISNSSMRFTFLDSIGSDDKIRFSIRSKILYYHPLVWSLFNNQLSIKLFPEIRRFEGYSSSEYKFGEIERSIMDGGGYNYYISIDKGSLDRYPYFQNIVNTPDRRNYIYHKMIDDELGEMFHLLSSGGELEDVTIILKGGSDKGGSLNYKDLKYPLYIFKDGIRDREILNNYCSYDLYKNIGGLGRFGDIFKGKDLDALSVFDSIYVKQDIVVKEGVDQFRKRWRGGDDTPLNQNNLLKNYIKFSNSTFIRGDLKLNIYPKSDGLKYTLYNVKRDPFERTDLSERRTKSLKFMVDKYEEICRDEYGLNVVNGYTILEL